LFIAGCGGGGSGGGGGDPTITNAETPTITKQPESRIYNPGNTARPLVVETSVSGGGGLSYQWYSNTENETNGTQIDDETANTFTPSTATEGTFFYYVIVTNTNNSVNGNKTESVTSNAAKIIVSNTSEGYYNVSFYDDQLDFIET
jgi:hypothetical protein